MRQYLLFDRDGHRFNEATVGGFIEEFEHTVSFAKLAAGDIIAGNPVDEPDDDSELEMTRESQDRTKLRRKPAMMSGTKEDVFSLDEGSVVLTWPERLSKASAEDLKDWLALIGRKIERATSSQQKAAEDELDDDEAAS